MDSKDKKILGKKPFEAKEEGGDSASRARNRTVMLTPEVTGQVRALLNQEDLSDNQADGFAPINSANPVNSLITRDTVRESTRATGTFNAPYAERRELPITPEKREVIQPVATRDNTPTNAPIDSTLVQTVRQQGQGITTEKMTKLIGFLVSFDEGEVGEVLDLRVGRWILSNDKGTEGNFLIVKHKSVSPLHAILKISDAKEIQVLDQLSENGTTIKKTDGSEEKLSGSVSTVGHGDTVVFGSRKFSVCLIP